MSSATELLRSHGLRVTEMRKACIAVLEQSSGAISSSEIEGQLKGVDRVTLYRTLVSFEESGLIHHSINDAGQKKYALCSDHCDTHEHHDNHVHFHCSVCGNTECLDNEVPTNLNLPAGYRIQEIQFNVMGTCDTCK